jgi:hypothetical protein
VAAEGGASARVRVRVRGAGAPGAWSFQNHVLPVMARAGCNSGACHGALAGKGGFKLSLRGYAPEEDHHTITRQARGRRVELGDPGRSLLLAKPTGAIPHKGGTRFEVGSLEYRVLSEWIAAGARPPRPDDARLERVEVIPERALLGPGDELSLLVRAHYSDGRVEDVTRWAKFSSADESVARVDEDGRLAVVGRGEGAIIVWFSSQIAIARATVPYDTVPYDTVPYGGEAPPGAFAALERRNFIDDLVLAQLERLRLPPSPAADDGAFIRRAYLDATGTLPAAEEVRAFIADRSVGKREELIERLLASPEFVDYWTYRWSDMLLVSGTRLRPEAVKAYYRWIRGHVEANTRWDELVRLIVTAQGESLENGATNFFALHQSPEEMTENTSQAFLGLSIACARCHNHPLEKWTNDQYYSMANLFARVQAKGWGGDPRSGDGRRTLFAAAAGELLQPRTGRPRPPAPLDGAPIPFDLPGDRRDHLAGWLTSPENPYFARAITNRIWVAFFGVGLVEPVDDLRVSNPAKNEALLTAASRFLIEHDFDLKALMRAILSSATYQRRSEPLPGNAEETRFYSRYYPRRLMAEVLLDAISEVTAVPSEFTEVVFPGADRAKTDWYPKGTRALQLYDSAVASYFLQAFGRNPREITCECERSDEPSAVQVLHITNGDTINEKLAAAGNRIDRLLAAGLEAGALIDEVYLAALARLPTVREKEQLRGLVDVETGGARRAAVEDLFWAVLSSREFLFNH